MNNKKALVLVVDDDESIRLFLKRQMERDGYRVAMAENGADAIEKVNHEAPDLVLLDAMMPGIDGFRVLEILKASEASRTIPVIMVTALQDQASRMRALTAGAEEFLTKPIDRNEVSLRVRNMLLLKQYSNLLAHENRLLGEMVEERSRKVLASYRETIATLSRAVAYKDEITGAHVRRISFYTAELASAMGMDATFCETIHYASPMHDIGKMAIPDAILLKPGPLTAEEWAIMKTHTTLGARLLGKGDSPYLQMGAEIALSHHERWDGTGYPAGLKGELIPVSARIMNICDQYDALRSERPYKAAFSHQTAVAVLSGGDDKTSPDHFDPEMLVAFGRCAQRFREIFETVAD
jgi:putative two-component system response regulator